MSIMKTPANVKYITVNCKKYQKELNFEYISHIAVLFPLLADIEQVDIDWSRSLF